MNCYYITIYTWNDQLLYKSTWWKHFANRLALPFCISSIDRTHKTHGEKSDSKDQQNPRVTFPRHLPAKDFDVSMHFPTISCVVNNRVKHLSGVFSESVLLIRRRFSTILHMCTVFIKWLWVMQGYFTSLTDTIILAQPIWALRILLNMIQLFSNDLFIFKCCFVVIYAFPHAILFHMTHLFSHDSF